MLPEAVFEHFLKRADAMVARGCQSKFALVSKVSINCCFVNPGCAADFVN